MRFCEKCGAEILEHARFCGQCGCAIDAEVANDSIDAKIKALEKEQKTKRTMKIVSFSLVAAAVLILATLWMIIRSPHPPEEIILFPPTSAIACGETATIPYLLQPMDAKKVDVTWKSDNTAVATVQNGAVTGKNGGTCRITATTENGKSAVCTITVVERSDAERVIVGLWVTDCAYRFTENGYVDEPINAPMSLHVKEDHTAKITSDGRVPIFFTWQHDRSDEDGHWYSLSVEGEMLFYPVSENVIWFFFRSDGTDYCVQFAPWRQGG